jgi:phosphopantetheine adenylyltransferase
MGKAKFIDKIKTLFGISVESDEPNKKIVKELIEKLSLRKNELKKELKGSTNIVQRETLKDSIKILNKQIKKGKALLEE